MRFGSICSGIEAASVAWHSLGWEAAWLAEVDVAASGVLAHRLGATAPVFPLSGTEKAIKKIAWGDRLINWGDMTKLPELVRSGEAAAPDVLCGGTPCQGFSVAGLRGGLADPRGQLTLSFVDLANAIDEARAARGEEPATIFWENVPGVRTDEGNAFGHFLAGLVGVEDPIEPGPRPEHGRSTAHWRWKKETGQHIPRWPSAGAVAGPRRTVAWRSSDAQYFGLAQRRERVFVVASAREGFDPQVVLFEFDGLRRDSAPSREAGEDVAGTLNARTDGGGFAGTDEACSGYVQPTGSRPAAVIAMAHGQGGAEISEERCPTLTCNHEAPIAAYSLNGFGSFANDLPTLRSSGGDQGGGSEALALCFDTTQITSPSNFSNPKPGDPCHPLASVALRGRDGGGTAELGDEVAGTLLASGDGGDKAHVLAFSCKDYGADATLDLAPTMRAMNHSDSHANAGGQLAVCVTGDITHTLKAEGFDASEDGTGRGQPIVVHGTQDPCIGGIGFALGRNNGAENAIFEADMAVRRLMPVECERLQGFPDSWTDVPIGNKPAADGPRYKQLGNSWAVPCVTWIGRRIAEHVAELDARPQMQISPLEAIYRAALEAA